MPSAPCRCFGQRLGDPAAGVGGVDLLVDDTDFDGVVHTAGDPLVLSGQLVVQRVALVVGRSGQLEAGAAAPPKPAWRVAARWRRTLLVALTLSQAWIATYFMTAVLPYHGHHPLEVGILALYAVLFTFFGVSYVLPGLHSYLKT